jgi:hypothetical protein
MAWWSHGRVVVIEWMGEAGLMRDSVLMSYGRGALENECPQAGEVGRQHRSQLYG